MRGVDNVDFDVESYADIESIRSRWLMLHASGLSTPFQSFAWCNALLDTVGRARGAKPHFLIVVDRRTREDLLLLPLVQIKKWSISVITMPDFGLSDYNMPLISVRLAHNRERLKQVWEALRNYMPSADLLRFQQVPELVDGTPNPLLSIMNLREHPYSSWQLHLPEPGTSKDVGDLVLSRRQQRLVRKKLNKIASVTDVIPLTVEEKQRLFEHMLHHRRARFQKLDRPDALDDPAVVAFYRRMLVEPNIVVSGLAVGDTVIATIFGLADKNQFYLLMTSFDSAWAEASPGFALIYRSILALNKQGVRVFDFTIGDESYKRRFKTIRTPIFEAASALSPLGVLMVAWLSFLPYVLVGRRSGKRLLGHASGKLKLLLR